MQKIFEILTTIPLFSKLKKDEIQKISERSEIKDIVSGETVTPPSDTVTVVLKGSVAVMKNELLMRVLSFGSVSGVASLYGDKSEPVSELKANSNSSLAFICGEEIRELIRQNSDFAEAYIGFLTSRIRFLNNRIRAYTSGCAEAKLAFHILYSDENSSGRFDAGVSMSKLADMLNLGRASLYRALDALESAGAIEKNGAEIRILSREALTACINKKCKNNKT